MKGGICEAVRGFGLCMSADETKSTFPRKRLGVPLCAQSAR